VRNLWIASTLALVVVGALALYANSLLNNVRERDDRLRNALTERMDGLRALDQRYPYTPRRTLDPARMPAYLEVRRETSRFLRERLSVAAEDNVFHAKETRNDVLLVLTSELNARKMSRAEYVAISTRWHALLARGDRLGLIGEWQRVVTTKEHPKGLPLPAPAKDATKAELELFRASEQALKETLHADLLLLLLPLPPNPPHTPK